MKTTFLALFGLFMGMIIGLGILAFCAFVVLIASDVLGF